MNKKRKGFTLVEVLVVVLIVGILAAIAIPSYHFTIEKSRATQGITSLTQIAKAQKTYNARRGTYADSMIGLPLDMKDSDGSDVKGAEFSDQYFDYKIFGDEFERARATRNTGEYELSVDYGTGQIFCRPIEHKICQHLNLAEGEEFIIWPQKVDCDPYAYTLPANNGRTCVRTLYKDGTKEDRVCYRGVYKCFIFDNDDKQIREIFLSNVGSANQKFGRFEYDPNTGERTAMYYYNATGQLESYSLFENGSQVSHYDIYSITTNDSDGTHWQMTYNDDGTPNQISHSDANWKMLTRQYYGDDNKVSRLEYRDNYGVRATVYYNSDGTIDTTRTSCTRSCEDWVPPVRSSLPYETAIPNPKYINYCDDNPDEEFVCIS